MVLRLNKVFTSTKLFSLVFFFFLWSVVLGFAFWRGFGFRTNSGGKVGANLRRKDNDLSAFVSWRILKRLFFFSFLNISALDSCEL
jgi:hypothetical protein